MNQYETLIDILYAHRDIDDKGITVIRNQNHETFISYKSLFHKALNRLYSLQSRGIKPGEEIILQIEDIEDFLVTFWAGVFGRFIVIPLPMRTTEESVLHLLETWKRLENPFLLTDTGSNGNVVSRIEDCAQRHGLEEHGLRIKEHTLFIDALSRPQAVSPVKLPEIQREDIAFIQYSSGSTGKPKGVVLTHDNILTNVRAIIRGMKVNEADTSLSWLPLTHDMGLIGFHLAPAATGYHHYLMPVPLFIRRPLLWLEKAAQHRVTVLGSPDFGLKFFLSAFNEEKNYGWDLSTVRLVFNGAEPINCTVCKQFGDNLKKYRLKDNCIFPVYGLAEAALAVTFPKVNESLKNVVLSRNTLSIGDLVETVDKEEENSNNGIGFADVGFPVAGCRVKIVDTAGKRLEENRLGRIFIKGKNVTRGYYKDDILTKNLIRDDGWLDTGDLGFMRNGRLIVTGRQKDVVVVNGQNYYLHDLERLAEEVEGIKAHKIAVCGINDPDTKEEALCAFVVFRRDIEAFIPLFRRLNNYIYRKAGISFKYIIPVQRLPITSSGKLKRHLLVQQYREGRFFKTLQGLRQCMEPTGQREQTGNKTDNPIEKQLKPIVCCVMEIEDIGIHDNLSEYGVNSIKLHQLHQEVETLYPGMVKIVDFYDHPTVSQLAALIAKRENSLVDNNNSHDRHLVSSKPVKMSRPSVKRLALLFSGQGSQHVGMGEEMCRYFPVANRTFEEASDILHLDLKALCFDGDLEELTRTENAQPALLTISVAKYRVYQQELGIVPFLGAGHSLGEYSALTCANAIVFSDAVKLVRIRGKLMQEACKEGTAGMMAVSGVHRNAVEEEIKIFTDPGNCVVIANYNSATQVVISGHKTALVQVGERLTAMGARVVPLKVSAAFHSPLMEPCAKAFAAELTKYTFHMPEWPVIANVNGLPYKDKESIPLLLKQQMTHPIQWQAAMEYMKRHGIDAAIELGPKKVLKNLMKKASRDIIVYSTNTREDLEELYELDPEDFVDKRPNFLERCLAMAVCTPNRNFNDGEFQAGVIEPFRKLKEMYYRLADEKKEPEAHHIKEAAALLRKIFNTKKVPIDRQVRRFNRIFEETETGHLFKGDTNEKFLRGPGAVFSKRAPGRRRHKNDIAVIGIAVRTAFADNVGEFWRNLIESRDCIHEIPDNRQEDIDNYFPYLFRIKLDAAGKKNKKRYLSAAYLKEVDKFDYRFFRLSPKEASLMDPCQRIFMETAYEVLEDAGYAGKKALEYETGVYVGYSDDAKLNYFQMVTQVEPGSIAVAIAGNLSSIVPSRISYFMDLTGPSLLVDTACSSSLVAVHLACQAIRNGDCEQAIVGGVRVNLMPIAHTAKVGIESSDGKTKTFDDDSDGTGVGEGVGAVLLKPLDKALEDRDHIYAVIKGSAVNQDGQSLGITAPSADAQARLLVKAWKNANVDPETISYIEAHGTGTRVGDPIEVEGIINAFKQFTTKKQFCGIGSVKTNIGHLFEGAGIFGFIKAVLALKHKTLPPVLHFKRPNRNIAFEESPVYVVDELTSWQTNGFPLRCGVTAFGFSGTNCHVVLEEAPVIEQPPYQPGNPHGYPFILALSAKSKESLLQLVKRYGDFLAVNHDEEFIDICYTANTGRQHLNHRLAVIAENTTDLLFKLKQVNGLKAGEIENSDIYYGEHRIVQDGGDGEIEAANCKIRDFVESGRQDISLLHDICELYIRGVDLEWGDFYKGLPVKRVCLPVYPFERKRCWLDIPPFEENVAKPLEGKLFFDMEWIEDELKPGQIAESEMSGIIIVIKDENGVGEEVAGSLRQEGRQVLEVTLGDSFRVLGNDCYQIDGSEAHYEKLLLMLEEKPIDRIIFMATLARKVPITSLKRLQQSQTRGAYNLFHLTKMLLKHYSTEKIEYIVIADFANKVTGKEKKLKPENAPLLGLAYAIDRECENFSAWCIDIDDTVKFDQIMAEIRAGKQYRAAAYRENRRYIERFIPFDIEDIEDSKIEIKNSGVYLVTGGTGGIGLEMGKYLASKTKGVNIALVNRSKMPDRDRWEDIIDEEADKRTVQKIKAIKEIEAMGANVCLFGADCSGFRQMKQVLAELRERFGKINGIIHGAGVEGEGLLVRKSEKKFTNVLNPKVAGTWILDRLTKDDGLDFLVLFSTVATFLMNPGQTDYTAANAYLDTFSEYRNREGKKTLAVNWVTWKETGMAVNFNANFDIIFKAIPTAQAVGAFDVVLNKKVNRVLIGELNLDSKLINLLKNAQFRLAAPIRNIIDAPDTPLKAQSADEQRKKIRKVKLTGREDGTYTKSELLVAKVWGEVLGFDELRIDDNFYELGGDSILATQVVNRINTGNNLKISLIEIFNYETIKDLAKYVESLS